MDKDSAIFIAGHSGLVGSAIVRNLQGKGYENLILKTHAELDLINQAAVFDFFADQKIDYVFLAAAKVGGILYNNSFQADFLYGNLQIANNIIRASAENEVSKLLFLGSSCIYPKLAPQPIKEEYLLTGPLEPTNEGYALVKIAGLKLCEKYRQQYGKDFISVMPTNLYGPGDNYHPENSHVIPGLMRRFHQAKISGTERIAIWGTGRPRREFLYVDDLAEALFMLMQADSQELFPSGCNYSTLNVGTGVDLEIAELAGLLQKVVGYEGSYVFDPSKPDGTPRKVLDVSKIHSFGWQAQTSLETGLNRSYSWALENNKF